MSKPRIGLQLIIYGGRTAQDLGGVLREIKQAGYQAIESGARLQIGDPRVQDLLSETGLAVAGIHGDFRDVVSAERVDTILASLTQVGGRYFICSDVAQGDGIECYEKAAPVFNTVGRRCQEAGVVFCYHNHASEFKEFGGVRGIHRLAELTDPAVVKLCIDVYWVHIGGERPVDFIARYADRAPYFHLKDGAPGVFKELGQGEVDLKAATAAALAVNPEWIVCEQDRTDKEVRQSITESRAYMRDELGL
ncbi:MAG TPA: sugar phosphate isomerase/epimerase [Armatimonadota bacterium]|nr:sugar phosphate isomerase/epimerase [Armatimonadota bacterium]